MVIPIIIMHNLSGFSTPQCIYQYSLSETKTFTYEGNNCNCIQTPMPHKYKRSCVLFREQVQGSMGKLHKAFTPSPGWLWVPPKENADKDNAYIASLHFYNKGRKQRQMCQLNILSKFSLMSYFDSLQNNFVFRKRQAVRERRCCAIGSQHI